MESRVHTFRLDLNWDLVAAISRIDRFDASWSTIERREGASLKQLKSVATVMSVGASTRIEGSRMTDDEVDVLLQNLDKIKLEDRDAQEVAGYFDTLDLITDAHQEITVTENNIKSLHKTLLSRSPADEWHRGAYKQHANAVEARLPDGTKQLVFQTTEPGFATDDAMRALVDWYLSDIETHTLVKTALFAYDFVSIHPFQDGNGRMSRLLTTLLLMKHGYSWIQYISFEHEIESRKAEYYRVLRRCQSERPGENVTPWLTFFFDALVTLQEKLLRKLAKHSSTSTQLSIKEKMILTFIQSHPGCKSGDIAARLALPIPTVKRILSGLAAKQLIERHGVGPGTSYTAT